MSTLVTSTMLATPLPDLTLTDDPSVNPLGAQRAVHPVRAVGVKYVFPRWWLNAALCIHRYEGSWYANTGNGYYGGMQFDYTTWRANGGLRYARYAHQTTPHNQLRVAYTTWKRRGWYPWPNTARRCGLL